MFLVNIQSKPSHTKQWRENGENNDWAEKLWKKTVRSYEVRPHLYGTNEAKKMQQHWNKWIHLKRYLYSIEFMKDI